MGYPMWTWPVGGHHAEVCRDDDGMYVGRVPDLPGCFASGRTLNEIRAALLEAVQMCGEA